MRAGEDGATVLGCGVALGGGFGAALAGGLGVALGAGPAPPASGLLSSLPMVRSVDSPLSGAVNARQQLGYLGVEVAVVVESPECRG